MSSKAHNTTLGAYGVLNFKRRICIPPVDGIIERIFRSSWFAILYLSGHGQDVSNMRRVYWWPDTKNDIAEFVVEFMAKF